MTDNFTNYIEEHVPGMLTQMQLPGVAIATIDAGGINFARGFGLADKEQGRAVDVDTQFQLASISKAVTSWGIMKLVEQGKLDLDAPVERYLTRWHLPPSQFDHDLVTARRLLSHTAGTSLEGFKGYGPGLPDPDLEQILQGEVPPLDEIQIKYSYDWNEQPDLDRERRPVFVQYPPGEKSIYSGGGFTILELLIEEISGVTFTDFMQTEILDPLGMTASGFANVQDVDPLFAIPYNEQGEPLPKYRVSAKAAGGLHSNIFDLARFTSAEMEGPAGELPGRGVISPESIELLISPVMFSETLDGLDFHAALGHYIIFIDGVRSVHHSGGNIGWRSIYITIPEARAGFCALINSSLGNDFWMQLVKIWSESL